MMIHTKKSANFTEPVSIFCNNAGINHTAGWRKCLDVNIVSKRKDKKTNKTDKEPDSQTFGLTFVRNKN